MPLNARIVGYITLIFALIFFSASALYVYFTAYHGWVHRIAFADDIGNLKVDNPVKVGGVVIGQVKRISRENNQARLLLRMRESVRIRRDYTLLNMDVGLMGDRALFLMPGDSGEVLPVSEPLRVRFLAGIAEGIRNADQLGGVILSLKELVGRYSRVDAADDSLFTTRFQAVLKMLDQSTLALEKVITERGSAINRTMSGIHVLARGLKREVRKMRPEVEAGMDKAEKLSVKTGQLLAKLEPLVNELDVMVNAIESGKGPLGLLVNDKQLYSRLITTIETIRKVINTLKQEGAALDVDLF